MTILLRLPAVAQRTGLRRTAIYDRINAGLLPPPVKLGPRASAWPADEIDACNDALVRGLTTPARKALVTRLIKQRRNLTPLQPPPQPRGRAASKADRLTA